MSGSKIVGPYRTPAEPSEVLVVVSQPIFNAEVCEGGMLHRGGDVTHPTADFVCSWCGSKRPEGERVRCACGSTSFVEPSQGPRNPLQAQEVQFDESKPKG